MRYFVTILFFFGFQLNGIAQTGKYCIENRFSETPLFDSSQIVVQRNIIYSVPKKWPGTGIDTLKLDLYYPNTSVDGLTQRPCIVYFYGGAWLLGSKDDAGIKQKCFEWARRGFVVAAPNYRLGWNCAASDLLGVCVLCQTNYYDMNTAVYRGAQDGKAAMRWIVQNRTNYKIDSAALFIGGESAGSYNAMHTAFWDHKYAKTVFNGTPYSKLGSIDSAGAYPGTPFSIKGIISDCGAVVNDTTLHLKKIPLVAFHDQADCVVPYQINQTLNCCATSFFWAKGSKELYTALSAAGVPAELHTVPGVTPQHCSYPGPTLVKEASCFVKKILCGLSPSGSSNYPAATAVSCNSLKSLGLNNPVFTDLKIYPVPATDRIEISGISVSEIANIQLLDPQGRVLLKPIKTEGSATIKISLENINNGYYLLQIMNKQGYTITQKILIQN